VERLVAEANRELFGSCTNIGECEAVCPKEIKLESIARMNRDFIKASWSKRGESDNGGAGG
jgi:succinate dehydrogenase / fumarate reductase iron-sulfur subunit